MSLTSIKQATEGSVISFQTKNPNDTTVWEGVLESVGTYRSIKAYTDPNAYNQAVRQIDPTVPSDVTTLTFFLITVTNNASISTMVPFADEWIKAGSLNELSLGTTVEISVSDPNNNPQLIVSILANAGYACKIQS